MPSRKNFTTSQSGSCTVTQANGSSVTTVVLDANKASYNSNDVRRVKPMGRYITPTDYLVTAYDESKPNGAYYAATGTNPHGSETGTLKFHGSPQSLAANTSPSVLSETFPTGLSNRTLIKARNMVKAQTVNLGQSFAERRQVSDQVLDTAKKLSHAAISLRHGQWKQCLKDLGVGGVKPTSKTLAGQWLGYKYGWSPLLSDIHGAVLALEKQPLETWMVTVKASSKIVQRDWGPRGADSLREPYYVDAIARHGCFIRIDVIPSNAAIATAAQLGLTNPAQIAWELLPFSFVADWFVGVGDFISQFDALLGWTVKGYSNSQFTKVDWKWNGRTAKVGNTLYYNSWRAHRHFARLSRVGGSSVPFAVYPMTKDPVSADHIANALALLRGAFR